MIAKPLAVIAAAAAVIAFCAAGAAAVNMDYTGLVDPYTGEPAESSATGSDADTLKVSSNVYYSASTDEFTIYCGSDEITSNITGGMATTDAVHFEGDALSDAALYLDGTELTDVDFGSITAPGMYILKLGSGTNGSADGYSVEFTIVTEKTGALNGYTMPSGFYISDATLNGESAAFTDSYISLQDEGDYVVNYVCEASRRPYSLTVTIDHTAPVLALSAVVNGKADGPVSLADAEPGASLSITKDGEEMKPVQNLTDRGQYVVRITDEAGNSTEYQFLILTYFNVNSLVFIALFIAGIAALGAYLWRAKTHLRVR